LLFVRSISPVAGIVTSESPSVAIDTSTSCPSVCAPEVSRVEIFDRTKRDPPLTTRDLRESMLQIPDGPQSKTEFPSINVIFSPFDSTVHPAILGSFQFKIT
jgi:hypothetical protein